MQHDPDLLKCRECDGQFDVARQDYFGPICPVCRGDA